jgi:hypothetical protein
MISCRLPRLSEREEFIFDLENFVCSWRADKPKWIYLDSDKKIRKEPMKEGVKDLDKYAYLLEFVSNVISVMRCNEIYAEVIHSNRECYSQLVKLTENNRIIYYSYNIDFSTGSLHTHYKVTNDENSIDYYAKNLLDILVYFNKDRTFTREIPIKLYKSGLENCLNDHIKAL